MRACFTVLLLPVLSLSFIEGLAQKATVNISDPPAWVNHINPPANVSDTIKNSSGYYYLVADHQNDSKSEQRFLHFAIKILNNEGVQTMSDISVDFDPSYQQLSFHKVVLLRNGKTMDKLSSDVIKQVQRETNMDRHMYDGRITALINLSDVRAGDIIEYAYTITGDNPVYEGKNHGRFYFQYNVPLEFQYTRLRLPENMRLSFKYLNGAKQPQMISSGGYKDFIWQTDHIKALIPDINTPAWYDPYPCVYVSAYASWEEVVNQFVKLYTLNDQSLARLRDQADELFAAQKKDSLIIEIIRFVQDEIRYLGFEGGLNSHKPDNPLNVLDQRYGDCKAKSFLLAELLKLHQIDASPILVNTQCGKEIEKYLPSPEAFDHCIVQINHNGKGYYVDPTINNQGGDLEHYYCPEYHKGLVLKQGEKSLTEIPFWGYSYTRINETFDMEEPDKGAVLHVSTVYKGGDADFQRGIFKGNDLESIQQDYLNFYSRLYPTIKTSSGIKINDDRRIINEFTVEEWYHIDSLWEKSGDEGKVKIATFYPLSMENYISGKQSPRRTMPYQVNYPVDIEHNTVIKMPEPWNVESSSESIADPAFVYSSFVKYENDEIMITHKYRTLSSSVKPDAVESFISKHDDVMENLTYMLTYDKTFANTGFKVSWAFTLFTILIIALAIFFAVRVHNRLDIETEHGPETMVIGGWLLLIGLGLIISPFKILYDEFKSPEYYNSNVWNALIPAHGSTKGIIFGAIMAIEQIFSVLVFVFTLLALVLYFKRRTIFPRLAVILYVSVFFYTLLDFLFVNGMDPSLFTEEEKSVFYKNIGRNFILVAIWVPYLIFSKRVKQTFVIRADAQSRIGKHSGNKPVHDPL